MASQTQGDTEGHGLSHGGSPPTWVLSNVFIPIRSKVGSMERVRSFLIRVTNVSFSGGTLCVKLSDRAPAAPGLGNKLTQTKKVCFLKEKQRLTWPKRS